MSNHAIEVVKKLVEKGIPVITNPYYMESIYNGKSTEQIKLENKKEADEQYPAGLQRELSLRGQRTGFIEFHRYMFAMTDIEIQQLKKAYKKFHADTFEEEYIYTDQSLLNDALDYQLCIRSADGFDIQHVSKDVLDSWKYNVKLAEDFPEITSEHLIHTVQIVKKH
jgi:hypothetical protein